MELIKIYFEEFGADENSACVDEITWNDLEMDEVFSKLNKTQSYIGEQELYKRLHELSADRDWENFEAKLSYLETHEQERRKIEKWLGKIGKRTESYYLPGFLHDTDLWVIKNGFIYHILQLLLLVFGLFAIITEHSLFPAGFLAVAGVNLVVYLRAKQKYEVYLYSLGSVRQLVDFCKSMVSEKAWSDVFGAQEIQEAVQALRKVSKGIGKFEVRKRSIWTGDTLALLHDYMMGITLYDISVFNHIMKVLDKKQDKLMLLYQFAGEIDMINAVAAFRREMKMVCVPQFSAEWQIDAEGLYHLLLEDAVSNNFSTSGRTMISGANASGKSTFMIAVAINVILAQTIHTCTAKRMKLPGVYVMTSMALRDDILSGESYYIKEARYLKRMLDRIEEGVPVLCVIDEILKGTNTKERLAASEAILRYLANKVCFVLIATHDLELVEKMKAHYTCYYFDSKIGEKDIYFDYLIHKGTGGKSNAIALLKLLQYPEGIVSTAQDIASRKYI